MISIVFLTLCRCCALLLSANCLRAVWAALAGDGATVYATSRSDVLQQCIGPPRMHAVGRSTVSQPRYPIDRIKSLAGDVIVFGVLPLIILRTRFCDSAPPQLSPCVCRAVAVYRLPDAVRCVAVGLCQSICRSAPPAGCYGPDNEPVFTANFIVCGRASRRRAQALLA